MQEDHKDLLQPDHKAQEDHKDLLDHLVEEECMDQSILLLDQLALLMVESNNIKRTINIKNKIEIWLN